MKVQTFENVWDAIEDTPEEAENMKIRCDLMIALKEHVKQLKLTQEEAAKKMRVTQPRVSDLMRGKINLFTFESLVNMAYGLGLKAEVRLVEPIAEAAE